MKKHLIIAALAIGAATAPVHAQSAHHVLRGAAVGAAGGAVAGAVLPGVSVGKGALVGAAGGAAYNGLVHKRGHHYTSRRAYYRHRR